MVALLQQHLATVTKRVAELEAQLKLNSHTSSKPPSSDPPSAPPRPSRTPRGRKAGGQVGHVRHERPTPEPDQISAVEPHYPSVCPGCSDSVNNQNRDACAPSLHYVWELPLVQPLITAHLFHTLCCHGCGELVSAPHPATVPAGAFGPRAAAVVALLHGRYRISHREVVNLFGDLFAFPLSLGSVVSLQSHVSTALAPVYEQVQTRVQSARVLNIDETGWPAGARRWLWAVVGVMATLFVVANSRGRSVLNSLLGPDYDGIVGSDRARMYLSLPPQRHQLCWAHLIRNVRALSERKGSLAVWAADFLVLSELVFRLWHAYRGGTLDRGKLAAALEPVHLALKALLERGASGMMQQKV